MNPLIRAFFTATGFCYFGGFLVCLISKNKVIKGDKAAQTALFLVASVMFLYELVKPLPLIAYYICALVYGIATVLNYIGLVIWMAYWKKKPEEGSGASQAFMTLWDLLLAVCFILLT